MLSTIKVGAVGFLIGLLVAATVATSVHFHKGQPAVEGKTAAAIANIKTETVPIKSIVAFAPAAKRRLDLPKAVQDNPQDRVTAATTVDGSANNKIVAAIIDAEGKTKLYVKKEPYPLFAFSNSKSLWLGYGIKHDDRVGRAVIQQNFFQIKAMK